MFQLVRRKDYVYGYQVRASIVFYQKAKHVDHLRWIKSRLGDVGYMRIRKDDMAEYTIVGIASILPVLKMLRPHVRLKRKHVDVAMKIAELLPRYTRLDSTLLLKVSKLVDSFGQLNYSKKRRNTSKQLQDFLGKFPVTTELRRKVGAR